MPTNDFLSWASGGSANIMGQSDYSGSAARTNGVQAGTASSALANKTWRQGANMAAMLGEFIRLHGYDALDDGDVAALETNYEAALTAFTNALIAAGATSFATLAEVIAGTVTGKAVDPAKLAALMQGGNQTYAAGAGSANAITASLTPAPAAYTTGMTVRLKLSTTNTSTAVTLNLNGLGAKTVKLADLTDPPAGALTSGSVVEFRYDGTYFQVISPTSRILRNMQVYASAGSYTFVVPAGVYALRGRCVGGGGSGGGSTTSRSAGGGGAGGYAEGLMAVTPGESIAITVGAGGAAVGSGDGNNGGSSSIGSYMSATGGQGGAVVANSSGGQPGVGSGGAINLYGGYGADGMQGGTTFGAIGGASYFGGGIKSASNPGTTIQGAPGSGGGSVYGGSNTGGLAGLPGIVILEW